MKVYLTLLSTLLLVDYVMSAQLLLNDTKPSADPRHNTDYYEKLTITQIKDQMDRDMLYVSRLMDTAEQLAVATGLIIPPMFYRDAREFVLQTLAPETLCTLDSCQSDTNKTLYAMIARDVYGFRHMTDRIVNDRQHQQQSVFSTTTDTTGADADEQQLLADLEAREESLFQALTYIADVKSRGPNGLVFMSTFHKMIYTYLEKEFPKINQAIQQLPTSDIRIKNIQLLLDDLLLLTKEPW
ncbi:uncharacterized protein LOC128953369 [Oppia nitens]|uniref:uncharacterized protein LOC128953369 n=1 Tax=Oppia nitens TaxID=1686743 RepID=UPI0023D97A9D|nr:uncharacterized protein LOC128953369 [Oppia nitens]